jgi:hypothetical protein
LNSLTGVPSRIALAKMNIAMSGRYHGPIHGEETQTGCRNPVQMAVWARSPLGGIMRNLLAFVVFAFVLRALERAVSDT